MMKTAKYNSLQILFFLLLSLSFSIAKVRAFDRAALHAERFTGLELSRRSADTRIPQQASAQGSDILISESTSPATFTQAAVKLAALPSGGWVAVWHDDRRGLNKVFMQRLDSAGAPVGPNEAVSGLLPGHAYIEPDIAVDTLGRIYLFFRDATTGLVLGSRLLPDFTVDLATFQVNDTSGQAYAGPFDMAIFPDGRMVVAWENVSLNGPSLQYRVYAANGSSVFGPANGSQDMTAVNRWVPAVAVAPGSGFAIVWEDYRNGRADIFARQFDGSGNPQGADFAVVPPPANNADQFTPQVAHTVADRYVFAWVDTRAGQEVYLQQYSATLGLLGGNVIATSGDTLMTNWDPDLAVSSTGEVTLSWALFGAENQIRSRRYGPDLTAIGQPWTVSAATIDRRWGPATAVNATGQTAAAWIEFVTNADLHLMLFDSTHSPLLSSELLLNDDSVGAASSTPAVVATSDWYNLVAFTDRRNDGGDIFLDAVSNAGVRLSPNRRVNQDTGPALQSEPALAASSGGAMVVWVDSRDVNGIPGQRVFARKTDAFGNFTGDEFLLNDSSATAVKQSPQAVLAEDGRGMVSWLDRRDGSMQVYGHRVDNAIGPLGADFLITDPATDLNNTDLHLALDTANTVWVIWLDADATTPTAKVRRYDLNGNFLNAFSWSSTVTGISIAELSADVTPGGELVLLWAGQGPGTSALYLTELAADGAVLQAPTQVDDAPGARPSEPSVSVSNNGYVSTVWVDHRDGRDRAYYQLYDNTFSPLNGNGPVSDATPEQMTTPATDAFRGRAWFVWSDTRAEGFNIYAADVLYLPTDVDDGDNGTLPHSFALQQNYPNPFNPTTTIAFTLPHQSEVTLTVFDILGRQVRTLSRGVLSAGMHSVIWDGRTDAGHAVASGVYFYRLVADSFTSQRKMVLLK